MKQHLILLVAAAIAAFALRCGGDDGGTPDPPAVDPDPSFAGDIQPVFTSSCALSLCHAAPGQAGLVLSAGSAYGNLVNVASTQEPTLIRVDPFTTAESYLVTKIEGRQVTGTKMPPNGSLSSSAIQLIKNWIIQGAKDN